MYSKTHLSPISKSKAKMFRPRTVPAEAKSELESLKGYSLVIGQLEIPQEVTTQAFATARSFGARTLLNPAPFAAISPELISLSGWTIPNESEFAGMHPEGLEPTSDENTLHSID